MHDNSLKSASNAFAPLEVSPNEAVELMGQCDALVAETLLAFEDYITHGRTLDTEYWEFLKTYENINIYRTYANKEHALPPSDAKDGREYYHSESYTEHFRPKNIPFVISTGCMPGTVEDAALGALGDSPDRTRLRTSYVYPEYHLNHLATIETPNMADPFRYAGIKWAIRELPSPWRSRDMVFIECSGLAVDSNGERVAYLIMNSVQMEDKLPELTQLDLVRSNGMTCFIYRQFDAANVEVFCATFADPKSDELVEASLNSQNFAESLISRHTVVESGYVRKLLWLMLEKTAGHAPSHTEHPTKCGRCGNTLYDKEKDKTIAYVCQVCSMSCCSTCSVSKEFGAYITREGSDKPTDSTEKVSGCCIACLLEAKNLSAWEVAQVTLLDPKNAP